MNVENLSAFHKYMVLAFLIAMTIYAGQSNGIDYGILQVVLYGIMKKIPFQQNYMHIGMVIIGLKLNKN